MLSRTDYHERVLHFYRQHRAKNLGASQAILIARHDARYWERSKKLDIMPSRYDAYDGEEITELPNGWKIKVEFQRDEDYGPPWKEHDGHGEIVETHCRQDHMGDWELNSERGWYRYYDWKATLPIAIKDRWDAAPYGVGTKHERAMRAMKADYEYLRAWCNDAWWYVGIIVTLLDENDEEIDEESCWGFESNCIDYLCSEARSWAAHMLVKARKVQHNVRTSVPVRNAMSEGARV